MKKTTALLALCLFTLAPSNSLRAANAFLVRNLVSDIPELADQTDANLVGSWGISESATSPFWVADAGKGVATLYNSSGGVIPLVVAIPPAKSGGQGVPTGTVFNTSTGFEVATGKPAMFLFDTLDGTISGWNSTVDRANAIVKVNNSSAGASYTGLAIGTSNSNTFLYAANFHAGTVDVFDSTFAAAMPGTFKDPTIPAGYAPFNVQNLGGKLYVTYALQNASQSFAVPGAGNGYVNVFDTAGALLGRLISAGHLNAPWGLAIAPANFGDFATDLLVGNFGDGSVNVFNPTTGAYVATLHDVIGAAIEIPNLWALQVGNGGSGGDPSAVYFTAGIPGPDGGNHGLFGRLQAAPAVVAAQVLNGASFLTGIAPNAWVSIKAENLASTTRAWESQDFVNGALPTELDGVSVSVNGKPAYIGYISPTQINLLLPAGTPVGAAQMQTTNNGLSSAVVTVQVLAVAPAFFTLDGTHIAATHANGTLIGATATTPVAMTPAKPGETIVLYGTGFGQTNPAILDGMLVTSAAPLLIPPTVTIGGASAQVTFSGLVGAGLYQINVVVPSGTPDGDIPVVALLGTATSQTGAVITVQH
jgi:uncharacterized protein (TIGR03118 family)